MPAPIRCASRAARRCGAIGATCTGRAARPSARASAESYFRYARDQAFIDIVGHQGNDFQITDAFWQKLNRLTAEFDVPGPLRLRAGLRMVRQYRHGRRPQHLLSPTKAGRSAARRTSSSQGQTSTDAIYTGRRAVSRARGEDAVVIAHVGGRYADIKFAHDGRLERAVEVHSTWGTFEWLLHDAFDKGYRVGIVCHSDDHKGRPGATRPGASTFGAIGGLTCYFMPELTRDALFDALRRRHHYGTTGTRLFLDLRGTLRAAGDAFYRRPAARAPRRQVSCTKP